MLRDTSEGIIINEAAVNAMGMQNPLGKTYMGRKIIGVIKDFNFRSLHSKISPLTVIYQPNRYNFLLLKIKSKDVTGTLNEYE